MRATSYFRYRSVNIALILIEVAEKSVLVWCFLRDGSSCVRSEEVSETKFSFGLQMSVRVMIL